MLRSLEFSMCAKMSRYDVVWMEVVRCCAPLVLVDPTGYRLCQGAVAVLRLMTPAPNPGPAVDPDCAAGSAGGNGIRLSTWWAGAKIVATQPQR